MLNGNAITPLPAVKGSSSKIAELGRISSNLEKSGATGSMKSMDTTHESDKPFTFFLEAAEKTGEDSDEDNLDLHEIPVEQFEDLSDSDVDESLEQAQRNINERNFFGAPLEPTQKLEELQPSMTKHPEVIDDYIRNYLSSKGLNKALEAFQNEWYELQQKEKLSTEDMIIVPDVYQQNQELADALQKLRVDVENYKEIAAKARATYDKLRKERDFHRMHHKRVVQEKNKLISDIKKLKQHYENYEPTLKQLQHKYEIAMKEKMLIKLERDRLNSKTISLEHALRSLEKAKEAGVDVSFAKPSIHPVAEPKKSTSKETVLPSEDRVNPNGALDLPSIKVERLKLIHTINAHTLAISGLKFHPRKPILASVSDDRSWKLWAFPSGELIMSGEGHKDWIADCDFHPKGTHLATASGDSTVKLWDFSKGVATLTLNDHTQAVWSVAFHDSGDFVASSSMDHTAKLWDISTGKCRQTFRGHADSVNQVVFQPYTNTLATCSGDKTVSLWDARTGLCSQTLFGHMNSINHVAFSVKGTDFASCDADGVVKLWDIRNTSELSSIHVGPHPANKVCFDPSGSILAVACSDGFARLLNLKDANKHRDIRSHDDGVQTILIDKNAEYMVTAGSDGTIKIFQ